MGIRPQRVDRKIHFPIWGVVAVVRFGAVWAFVLLLLVSQAEAGSREDPELRDAANDQTRYPGVPTTDPTVDIRAIWFEESLDAVIVNMELAQIGFTGPDVPNVNSAESYAVYVFIDGEGERTPCSGWGAFGVRWDSRATADLEQGWHYDGTACPAERESVEFAVMDNVISWVVPKAAVPRLLPGAELTVARADAWSGDTWPATPDDRADNLPSRAFTLAVGEEDLVAEPKESPASTLLVVVAAALVAVLVRRQSSK